MPEIERTFLLDELPATAADVDPTRIDQGYLVITDDVEVRVRARAGDRLLTVKGGRGEVRTEVTVPVSAEQFDELWAMTEGRRLRKRRWVLPDVLDGDVDVEVDRFDGALDGLVLAEVEFDTPEASRAFTPPDWFGREVTDDDRYRNAAMATEPPPR